MAVFVFFRYGNERERPAAAAARFSRDPPRVYVGRRRTGVWGRTREKLVRQFHFYRRGRGRRPAKVNHGPLPPPIFFVSTTRKRHRNIKNDIEKKKLMIFRKFMIINNCVVKMMTRTITIHTSVVVTYDAVEYSFEYW